MRGRQVRCVACGEAKSPYAGQGLPKLKRELVQQGWRIERATGEVRCPSCAASARRVA